MFPPTSEQQGRAGEIFCHGQKNKTVPELDSVSVMVVCSRCAICSVSPPALSSCGKVFFILAHHLDASCLWEFKSYRFTIREERSLD